LRRKILIAVVVAVVALAGLAILVGSRAVRELSGARDALTASPMELTAADFADARDHLRGASRDLDGLAARVLGVIPVAGQNVAALDAATTNGISVLNAALDLRRTVDRLRGVGLMDGGRIRLKALHELRSALREQTRTLTALVGALEDHRSGWLVPPLWDEMTGLLRHGRRIQESAQSAGRVLEEADAMLGADAPRTYLIVLMNNAELRAAGGIPSGIGTITVSDGAFELGDFYYTPELSGTPPYERVRAPNDFKRRFGEYGADTRFWVNTTFSADIPDVAVVSARLFRAATGIKPDGVLFADPRGVAALMDRDATITVPESGRVLTREELPAYAYLDVYLEETTGRVADRHQALLEVGRLAFEEIVSGDFGRVDDMATAGAAFAGGHLRFVAFDRQERAALDAVGVTGDLERPDGDALLVTTWNSGGDKLDYWARRDIRHSCSIGEQAISAHCSTAVTIRNVIARGLPKTVANRPYGVMKTFVELLVPRQADLQDVFLSGEPVRYYLDHQDGHSAVGVYVRIPRREHIKVRVAYDLAVDGSYSLRVTPQPLAVDATLELALEVPSGWTVPGLIPDQGRFTYEGPLVRPLFVQAGPTARPGIPGLWDRLVAFWRQPVF
jgi:hypothetical protein